MERHRIIRQLLELLVTDMLEATDARIKESRVKSPLEIQKLSYNVIGFNEDLQRHNRELKDFLYTRLYRHYRVMRMQVKAERTITNLFNAYLFEPLILPDHIQTWISSRGLERTICDYIAGMTDRFAIDEHERLYDPYLKP
jgi:dGTPase